jgi:glycosyltransferase involved in cell wall biosynthesis
MKPLFIISSPFDTYSGYGARSRDLIKAIVETDKYNVRLLSQRWGATPFGFCENNPEWNFLLNLILPNNQIPKVPEIWAQVTIPSEFQPIGKYNIGFTAGIESNIAPADWIEGMNRMDLNIVSSEHSKTIFENSTFEKRNNQTNNLEGIVKLEKPVKVLFEGANTDIYKVINTPCSLDFNIKEDFAYLFVGHWMQGELGEDRKNVGLLVKAFYETFKNKTKKPALILKTSQVGSSYMDREEILRKIKLIKKIVNSKNLPNVYLLHGEFTDEEMNEIYNHSKVKAMVSLTKGEGFGRPLLEFTLSKKPLLTTGWSGQMDFLNPEFTNLIQGQLTNVHPSAANQWLIPESQWFSPDHGQIGSYLKDIFENYKNYTEKSKRQAFYSKTNFSWEKMKTTLSDLLDNNIPEFPKEVKIKLPSIKKIELPKKEPING